MSDDVEKILVAGEGFYSVPRTDAEIAARVAQLHSAITAESKAKNRQTRIDDAIADLMARNPNWSKAHATRMFYSMMYGTSYAAAVGMNAE